MEISFETISIGLALALAVYYLLKNHLFTSDSNDDCGNGNCGCD